MTTKTKNILTEIIIALLVFTFTATAISKFRNLSAFEYTLRQSPLLKPFSEVLAWAVPVVEVILALLLLVPGYKKRALQYSFFLIVGFTIYISSMLLFVSELPCSCGGFVSRMTWIQHLIFNILFCLLAWFGWRTKKGTNDIIAINRGSRKPVIE